MCVAEWKNEQPQRSPAEQPKLSIRSARRQRETRRKKNPQPLFFLFRPHTSAGQQWWPCAAHKFQCPCIQHSSSTRHTNGSGSNRLHTATDQRGGRSEAASADGLSFSLRWLPAAAMSRIDVEQSNRRDDRSTFRLNSDLHATTIAALVARLHGADHRRARGRTAQQSSHVLLSSSLSTSSAARYQLQGSQPAAALGQLSYGTTPTARLDMQSLAHVGSPIDSPIDAGAAQQQPALRPPSGSTSAPRFSIALSAPRSTRSARRRSARATSDSSVCGCSRRCCSAPWPACWSAWRGCSLVRSSARCRSSQTWPTWPKPSRTGRSSD